MLPPLEDGENAMKRRHILVERNRMRRQHYASTREALIQDDIREAEERRLAKERQQQEWKEKRAVTSMHRPARPLPGFGPDGKRQTQPTGICCDIPSHVKDRLVERRKKELYQKLYEDDMRQQLADRRQTVQKKRADDEAQGAALRQINEEQCQMLLLEEERKKKEEREYTERLKKLNAQELQRKQQHQLEQYNREENLRQIVKANNKHLTEMDDRQTKNASRLMQLQNEEALAEALRNRTIEDTRNANEVEALIKRDKRLLREEQEAEEAKRERFRKEFEDTVRRDREFRRIHNYDEPAEVTRQKHEQIAESYRLLQQEEAMRKEEGRAEYKKDLLNQIKTKQEYEMRHFDAI